MPIVIVCTMMHVCTLLLCRLFGFEGLCAQVRMRIEWRRGTDLDDLLREDTLLHIVDHALDVGDDEDWEHDRHHRERDDPESCRAV